mmetsp:Transcript_8832/g.17146  ORF Transcript_8832/g.17146 Transcript_8832/m.17146 type:complete len:513 (+) Transcript_8832:75-1613(+)
MFSGVSAVVVSGLYDFSKASGDIIMRNIVKLGGKAVHYKQPLPKQYTHVITPSDITHDRMLECLKLTELPQSLIVSAAWAIESVKCKRRLPEGDYLWREVSPRKTSLPDNVNPNPKKASPLQQSPPRSPQYFYESQVDQSVATAVQKSPYQPKYSQVDQATQDKWDSKKHLFSFAMESSDHAKNDSLAKVFEFLEESYKLLDDKGRHFSYREVVARLHSLPFKVSCVEQLKGQHKFGEKILRKIGEILETGTCRRAEALKKHELLNCINTFNKIWGVGHQTAKQLYRAGYRTIEQIKENPPKFLNANQLVGLELFDEINEKMPREEAALIIERVEQTSKAVVRGRPLVITPCGSYRRGRQLVGDVDILMTFEDGGDYTGVLEQIVTSLEAEGLLTHRLIFSGKSEFKKPSHDLYGGVCRLPGGKHRRIDLKFYPRQNYAWALLHFTGSAHFNRSLRLFAKKKGFRLSDEGYFSAVRTKGETMHSSLSAVCYTEADIFALFGMNYKTPEERDI